jgi:hypothetical protein
MGGVLRRAVALPVTALRDTARRAREPKAGAGVPEGALEAAIAWLVRTHEATGRRGSSKGFSLLHGWLPAYPETTGYVIETLLAHAARTGDDELREHAVRMGEWEIEVQNPDGGVMEGALSSPPARSVVFNTGMVIFGWIALHENDGDERWLEAAVRGGRFLSSCQQADGSWQGAVTYHGIPHSYHARVSWGLLRLAAASGEQGFRDVAAANLDWVLSAQEEDGWLPWCVFRPGTDPNSHGLAYTMRGLLESSVLLGEERYLEGALRVARPLLGVYRRLGRLPARYRRGWEPAARSICVTGLAQTGGVWLRLAQETGDEAFRSAGADAVAQAAAFQARGRWEDVNGAVPGSFPIYGRYAPLQYPNWAAKFLADSLALREAVLADAG